MDGTWVGPRGEPGDNLFGWNGLQGDKLEIVGALVGSEHGEAVGCLEFDYKE